MLHRGHAPLGAHTSPDGLHSARAQRDLLVAKAVCYTCYEMYARMPTGIAPEYVTFNKNGGGAGADFSPGASAGFYILRPETVESLFVLHQLTRDPIYREWSRKIFEAIEKHCKTSVGYGALPDVRSSNRRPDDRMESFFLAETLKYLYLIQDPHHPTTSTATLQHRGAPPASSAARGSTSRSSCRRASDAFVAPCARARARAKLPANTRNI